MCGTVRELIPDVVGGRISETDRGKVERHAVECSECAAELRLAGTLFASRPVPPRGLLERLLESVHTSAPTVRTRAQPPRVWWSVAAAAVAAFALGIGISSDPGPELPVEVPGFAYEVEEGDIWVSDDGLLAGAPLFDDLSDDALLQLLEELSVASAGGSA
jgi:anti-sigma factor RsiW